jgi:hypothetical protein
MMMYLFWRWFVGFVVSLILQYTCSLQCSSHTHTVPVEQMKNKVVKDWEESADFLSLPDSRDQEKTCIYLGNYDFLAKKSAEMTNITLIIFPHSL